MFVKRKVKLFSDPARKAMCGFILRKQQEEIFFSSPLPNWTLIVVPVMQQKGNCFPDLRPVQSSVFLSFLWLNQFLWLLQNPIVFWAKLLGRCLDCGDHPPTLIQPQSSKLSDIMLDLHKVSYNLTCNEIITIFSVTFSCMKSSAI